MWIRRASVWRKNGVYDLGILRTLTESAGAINGPGAGHVVLGNGGSASVCGTHSIEHGVAHFDARHRDFGILRLVRDVFRMHDKTGTGKSVGWPVPGVAIKPT